MPRGKRIRVGLAWVAAAGSQARSVEQQAWGVDLRQPLLHRGFDRHPTWGPLHLVGMHHRKRHRRNLRATGQCSSAHFWCSARLPTFSPRGNASPQMAPACNRPVLVCSRMVLVCSRLVLVHRQTSTSSPPSRAAQEGPPSSRLTLRPTEPLRARAPKGSLARAGATRLACSPS